MKYLIPVSFALSGAYLVGLPLDSYIRAVARSVANSNRLFDSTKNRATLHQPAACVGGSRVNIDCANIFIALLSVVH